MCKSKFIADIKERKEELELISDMTVIQAIEEQIRQDEYWLERECFSLGRKKSRQEKVLEIQKHKRTHQAYKLMIDGLAVDEIANVMNLSKSTIYRLLRNASAYLVEINRARCLLVNIARSADAMIKIELGKIKDAAS